MNSIEVHPLWYICITVRSIIAILPLVYLHFSNNKVVNTIANINKYILLFIGLGFLHKSIYGSNNEVQINKVFWHKTRIVHAALYLLAFFNYDDYKLTSLILFIDVIFSIGYRFINGHFS